MRPEPLDYGDRQVYTVSAFNSGVASWIARLPELWVEGEVTELRRQQAWQSVFFTLVDPDDGATLGVSISRARFDRLRLELDEGARVHVRGRPELYAARGLFRLRARTVEPVGLGGVLAGIERLRRRLAGEGLFDPERKLPLPALPRCIGLVTGNDAAAKRDVIAAVTTRFPAARMVVLETLVQGPRAALAITGALQTLAAQPGVDVIVLARGGGSFDDLLPFSDERVVRAVASCPVPVVSAVGHEHDTPLCDLAAAARASTPTAAARLVVPDAGELHAALASLRARLASAATATARNERAAVERLGQRLAAGPRLLLGRRRSDLALSRERLLVAGERAIERRRAGLETLAARLRALSPTATLARGYAIVFQGGAVVREAPQAPPGSTLEIRVSRARIAARVERAEPAADTACGQ